MTFLTTMAYGIIVAFACTATTATRALPTILFESSTYKYFLSLLSFGLKINIKFFENKPFFFYSHKTVYTWFMPVKSPKLFLHFSLLILFFFGNMKVINFLKMQHKTGEKKILHFSWSVCKGIYWLQWEWPYIISIYL